MCIIYEHLKENSKCTAISYKLIQITLNRNLIR